MSLRVTAFMYGRLPAPLPRPADFPGHGEWSAAACHEGLGQWRDAAIDGRRAKVEPQVLDALDACTGWMHAAVEKPGSGVAGFGY